MLGDRCQDRELRSPQAQRLHSGVEQPRNGPCGFAQIEAGTLAAGGEIERLIAGGHLLRVYALVDPASRNIKRQAT